MSKNRIANVSDNGNSIAVAEKVESHSIAISAPNMKIATFLIRGTAPYVCNKFSEQARGEMHAAQEAGSQAKSKRKRKPKDFRAAYEASIHRSTQGWIGMPAPAFRAACISACRLVGYKMTLAKLAVFIVADGIDKDDATPLVRITNGQPKYFEVPARNANGGCDLRARAMFEEGWEALLRVQYDNDTFSAEDIANLVMRVGMQVGIGAGRHDSRESTGLGWGTFEIANEKAN